MIYLEDEDPPIILSFPDEQPYLYEKCPTSIYYGDSGYDDPFIDEEKYENGEGDPLKTDQDLEEILCEAIQNGIYSELHPELLNVVMINIEIWKTPVWGDSPVYVNTMHISIKTDEKPIMVKIRR